MVEAGGYRTDTVGKDMELVVKMHRMMRLGRKPYRITFVPDPICWTEVPEDFTTLRNQRVWWRFVGLLRWATGKKGHWGKMKRSGTWAKK